MLDKILNKNNFQGAMLHKTCWNINLTLSQQEALVFSKSSYMIFFIFTERMSKLNSKPLHLLALIMSKNAVVVSQVYGRVGIDISSWKLLVNKYYPQHMNIILFYMSLFCNPKNRTTAQHLYETVCVFFLLSSVCRCWFSRNLFKA